MELIERIQLLEAKDKAKARRIAKLEQMLAPKKETQPRKRISKYVCRIKGVVKTKADAHRAIERKFAKKLNRAA